MIVTGTADSREAHSAVAVALNLTMAVGVPAALLIAGILRTGWGGISWLSALLAGALGALAFLIVAEVSKRAGWTRLDFPDLLGSVVARPHSRTARVLGLLAHHINGALLAVAWAYGLALAELPANWPTAALWGVVMWALGLMLLSSVGAVHPAIRRAEMTDPGGGAMNFGRWTPFVSLVGHLVYAAFLAGVYSNA